MNEKLQILALDLRKNFPRSPRETLGGYVIAGRTLDKCRAILADSAGEYHFDCPLDRVFFDFTGIVAKAFKDLVAKGATDPEVAVWIEDHSRIKEKAEVVAWNNKLRATRPCDMPIELQMFLEDYIPEVTPRNRPVYVWFDIYDLEEQRI